jgi:AraC-like DNA-binding protein
MTAGFALLDHHLEAPRAVATDGRVVLSRLPAGRSAIGSAAPSVKLILSGEALYEVDGRGIRVRAGEMLYLDAGEEGACVHREESLGLCLMLPPAAGPTAADPLLGRAFAVSAATSNFGRALQAYGQRIAAAPAAGQALAPTIIAHAEAAIAEPLDAGRAAAAGLDAAKPSTRRDILQRLERARAHLHGNLHRNVALGELASVARLSQFHLARYFKRAFGAAPIAYHRALRLERAARFLSRGEGSVAQAAELIGYSDAVALSHAFRKHFGAPPQRYAMTAQAA